MDNQIFGWVSTPIGHSGTETHHGYIILTEAPQRYYDFNGNPVIDEMLRVTVRGGNGQQTSISFTPTVAKDLIQALSEFLSAVEQRDEEHQQECEQKAARDGAESQELYRK